MKYLYVISFYLLCSTPAFLACASSGDGVPFAKNTFNGQTITPDSLPSLMPPVPPRVTAAFATWASRGTQPKVLRQILDFAHYPHALTQRRENNTLLATEDYKNLSRSNYVFAIEEGKEPHVAKIAGPVNQLLSMLMGHGVDQNRLGLVQEGSEELLDNNSQRAVADILPQERVKSYQTASRAAYYLVVKELIEKQKRQYITTPPTYLLSYPLDIPLNVTDAHAVIIQQGLPATATKLTADEAAKLPSCAVDQLVDTVIEAGLWNLNNNIFIIPADGKKPLQLSLIDLEQPNNTSPKPDVFFHNSDLRYSGNVEAGIGELLPLFAGNSYLLNRIRDRVLAHPNINSERFNPGYRAAIVAKLDEFSPVK